MSEPAEIFTPAELAIVTDEEILRQPSRPTSVKECQKLRLFDRLPAANAKAWTAGVGMAAVQLGVHVRFAFFRDKKGQVQYLMNPRILAGQGAVPKPDEGCLSIPHKRFVTWRFDSITYEKEVSGKLEIHTAKGWEAQIIQHEVDHMNGILCCDRTERPHVPGRNEPCSCGSGVKFKKCCEAKGVKI